MTVKVFKIQTNLLYGMFKFHSGHSDITGSKMMSGETTTTTILDSELWIMIFQFISYLCTHKPTLNEETLTASVKRNKNIYNRDQC